MIDLCSRMKHPCGLDNRKNCPLQFLDNMCYIVGVAEKDAPLILLPTIE